MTEDLISKQLPLYPATTKGHLKQEFKDLLPITKDKTDTPYPHSNPELEDLLSATHDLLMPVITKEEGVTYSDLADCYPIKSAHGNKYILICYYYDSNAILAESLPSGSGTCINKGFQKLLDALTTARHNPKLHIMDNESFDILKKTRLKRNISHHIFPRISIARIPQKDPSRLSKATLLQV